MTKHGHLNVSDLAKATGIPQPTLYQLYTGVTEKPRKKTLNALADFFSVSMPQLLGEAALPSQLPKKIKQQLDLNTAPLLNWEELHHWPHNINLHGKKEIFLEEDICSENTFALHMPNQSMEPLFPNGCLLIFDVNKKPITFTLRSCISKIPTYMRSSLTQARKIQPDIY